MGVLGAFFGCRGDGGFDGCCSGASIGDGGFNGRCSGASIGDGGFMLACISGCRGVIGFKVAMSRVLCAKKFALRGLIVGVSAKEFSQRAENTPISAFCGVLGELFREYTAGWVTLGELFRACCGKGRHSDGFFVE